MNFSMCIAKAELSLLGMELHWHSFGHNLATQLSGRLLIISYQITIDLEMKTFSQQRLGQTRLTQPNSGIMYQRE